MRRLTSGLLVAAMALAFVAVASTKADAAFVLYICDNATCTGATATIGDGSGSDLNPAAGRITAFETGIGGFNALDVETAVSYPALGSPTQPILDITYQATGTGSAWFYIVNTGFTLPSGTATLLNNGNTTNASAGGVSTATSSLYGGTSNTSTLPLDLSHLIVTLIGNGTTSGAFTPGVNPYALTLLFHLSQTSAAGATAFTTGDLNASVVPEPASLALFGLGMLGVGYMRRRRHV